MKRAFQMTGLAVFTAVIAQAADRINHEGRILGPAPVVTAPILFNTPEADTVLSAMQVFPVNHPWNEDVSRRPLLPNSSAMIAQILADLSASRRTLRVFFEMNFALVPDDQPPVSIDLFNYPDESDPGPYPIPANLPVETWPRETGALTLVQWQRDVNNDGGDRHAIIVQPGRGWLWETWLTKLTTDIQLQGSASFSGAAPAIRWSVGSGLGDVVFADAERTNTTATCTVPGSYTLVLSADDGVHAVAYSTVHFEVKAALRVGIERLGTHALLSWNGGVAPFVLDRAPSLPAAWVSFMTTSVQEVSLPIVGNAQIFRVHQP
jgi:hypothetical protein